MLVATEDDAACSLKTPPTAITVASTIVIHDAGDRANPTSGAACTAVSRAPRNVTIPA